MRVASSQTPVEWCYKRKEIVSGDRDINTHLKAARWYTVSAVKTIHLQPSLSAAIHSCAVSFLPAQTNVSSLDYIDQNLRCKVEDPLDTFT